MKTIVGIFSQRQDAENAVAQLQALGFTHEHLSVLVPGASNKELAAVPVVETEQPGMSKALGGVIGGGIGLLWGGAMGRFAANFFVPGVGHILALGAAYAALSGLVGAAAGAAAGGALEQSLTTGLPADELFVYEDALRQGRTVVIALAADATEAETIQDVLMQAGAESVDAAREQWWVGLRDAEEAAYEAPDGAFARVESAYRGGFEAALQPQVRGRSYEEVKDYLRERYPTVYLEEPFRWGYVRGQAHYRGLLERHKQEMKAEEKTVPR
jgi:hypothetical protein